MGIFGDAAGRAVLQRHATRRRRWTDSSRYTTAADEQRGVRHRAHASRLGDRGWPCRSQGTSRADTLLATSIKNAAAIAKGRTLVDLGRFTDAAAAVAGVPTNYTYNVTFSQATNDNNIWGLAGQVSTRARFVVGDSFDTQGITKNALPFCVGEGSARSDDGLADGQRHEVDRRHHAAGLAADLAQSQRSDSGRDRHRCAFDRGRGKAATRTTSPG